MMEAWVDSDRRLVVKKDDALYRVQLGRISARPHPLPPFVFEPLDASRGVAMVKLGGLQRMIRFVPIDNQPTDEWTAINPEGLMRALFPQRRKGSGISNVLAAALRAANTANRVLEQVRGMLDGLTTATAPLRKRSTRAGGPNAIR